MSFTTPSHGSVSHLGERRRKSTPEEDASGSGNHQVYTERSQMRLRTIDEKVISVTTRRGAGTRGDWYTASTYGCRKRGSTIRDLEYGLLNRRSVEAAILGRGEVRESYCFAP